MGRSKKIAGVGVAAVVALALIAAAVVWLAPVFTVKQVVVTGNAHLNADQIEQASGISQGENLARLDAQQAAAGVASMPWVESATVARSFPSTVEITISEREAVGYIKEGGAEQLIDADGARFSTEPPPPEAVEITGVSGDDAERLSDAAAIIAAVPAPLRAQLAQLKMESKYSAVFVHDDGRTIFWGANEDNSNKARALAAVLKMDGHDWNISNPEIVAKK